MTGTDSLRVVRDTAVALERQLDAMGATGNGLGEKYRSLNLPESVQGDLRQVVHLRNQVMHDGVDLTPADMARFQAAADRAMSALSGGSGSSRPGTATGAQPAAGCGGIAVAVVVVLGLAWFLSSIIHNTQIDVVIWILALLMVYGAFTSGKK